MPFIYVTGISGSGKSKVCKGLARRGYEAHEGDNRLCDFYDNDTGLVVERPRLAADRTPGWRSRHTWKMSRDKLIELKSGAGDKPVFVCGVASNEDEYLDVFDIVFGLMIDHVTLRYRIENRTNSDFGKSDHEMKTLLEWQQTTEDYYQQIKAHIIDATKPPSKVVDAILAYLSQA